MDIQLGNTSNSPSSLGSLTKEPLYAQDGSPKPEPARQLASRPRRLIPCHPRRLGLRCTIWALLLCRLLVEMRAMLVWSGEERSTARGVMETEWMKTWALLACEGGGEM